MTQSQAEVGEIGSESLLQFLGEIIKLSRQVKECIKGFPQIIIKSGDYNKFKII